ncbi:MAG TPA: AfsR/SARP family transcriptional regulator [Streptosporangiaceae bacterium]
MEFRILGPLYADAGNGSGPVEIRQPLLQAALGVLLLRANLDCPRSLLIEALWGSEPPGSPEAALRVCISRLRLCLGACAGRLTTVGPLGGRAPDHRIQRGYRMTVRPGELDVDEFKDLADQGHAELDSGNASTAASSLAQALALWGDPPMPDVPDAPAIAGDVAWLQAQRRAVGDALIDAHLAMARYEEVARQLRPVVLADPGRERACGQLMQAYQALGMRNEALEVYQLSRQAAREEHGTEPGPRLTHLYGKILAEELAADPPPQLSVTLPDIPRYQVPAPPADFTGRAGTLARTVSHLSRPGLPVAVISGGPGVGKSALAAAVALALRDRYPDGQLYADLGGIAQPRNPQDVLSDILQSLGIPARAVPAAGAARGALYRSLLADRKILVVLDHAARASLVRPLLPGGTGPAVLVTSRGRLSGLSGARIVDLDGLAEPDALALLGAAAGAERVHAEPEAASAIVAACAGLPLALRLAGTALAARPGLTLARLAAELTSDRALHVLTAEDVSVSSAIADSYRAVPSQARQALSLAAITMPAEIPAWALRDLGGSDAVIGQLAGAGLISHSADELAGPRYGLHPLIRAYAAEQRQEAGRSRTTALAQLRAGWIWRTDKVAAEMPSLPFLMDPPRLSPPAPATGSADATDNDPARGDLSWACPDTASWLASEQRNLSGVAVQACADGDYDSAIELASRLATHHCIRGPMDEPIALWRGIAVSAAAGGGDVASARAEYFLACLLAQRLDGLREAAEVLTECVPILERAGDDVTAAYGYALMAHCASENRRHAAAIKAARRALEMTAGGDRVACAAHMVLALTFARVGMTATGAARCREALREAEKLREPAYTAQAILALAEALTLSGQPDAASDWCREGADVARSYGSDFMAARFSSLLGRAGRRDPRQVRQAL